MLVLSLISSVRLQLKALEETLELLETELTKKDIPPGSSTPICPKCGGGDMIEARTMGHPSQVACRNCSFVGDLN